MRSVVIACGLLASLAPCLAPAQSAPASATLAHPALGSSPSSKCPELHTADDGAMAVVVFRVSPYGKPSDISIKTSSQSAALDEAAMKCVARMRFQPAVRIGDAVPVESWQQIGWRWREPPAAPAAAAAAAPAAAPVAPGSTAPALPPGDQAEVRACTDTSGRLIGDPAVLRSSGDGALDAAAVRIARAGAGNYRPRAGGNGCAQLTIRFESR
ncbi:MAG TPA: TonB family protein [Steroidobacteraceae bacterium]|nr:TonB family protein [Steroidobacteraceae bacterium]